MVYPTTKSPKIPHVSKRQLRATESPDKSDYDLDEVNIRSKSSLLLLTREEGRLQYGGSKHGVFGME